MTDVKIVNAANDAANNNISEGPNSIQTSVGSIEASDSMIVSNVSGREVVVQNLPPMDLDNFLTRSVLIGEYTITDSNPPEGLIGSFNPYVEWYTNTKVQDKLKNYSLWRGTMELSFVVTVPGNSYGAYVFSALPEGSMVDNTDDLYHEVASSLEFDQCMQVDNYVRFDCAASTDATMELPFLWPYDFAKISDLENSNFLMYKIFLFCLSPVRTAIPGGFEVGSIKIYARLKEDYVLSVPRLQGKHNTGKHGGFVDQVKEKATAVSGILTGVKNVSGMVEQAAGALSAIPAIAPFAAVASSVAGGVHSVLSMLGFSRHNAEMTPVVMVQRSVTNVAQVDGDDPSESASLYRNNMISVDPAIMGKSDGMDQASFTSLFSRWTHIKSSTWTPSNVTGDILVNIPVTPFYSKDLNTVTRTFTLMPAGYVGLPFSYWRGDMEYLVICPISKLHRGAIQAVWIPVGSTIPEDPTNVTYNEIRDVVCGDDRSYTIGYARELPYLENQVVTSSSIINYNYTNGRFILRVVNPLRSQNPDGIVNIHVFARAKPNMEFNVLRNKMMLPLGVDPEYVSLNQIRLQGTTGDGETIDYTEVQLVPSSGTYPAKEILFGEGVESVRALMQKPSRFVINAQYEEIYADDGGTCQYIPILGPVAIRDFVHNYYSYDLFNFAGYYRQLFVGTAASERFKVISQSSVYSGFSRDVLLETALTQQDFRQVDQLFPFNCIGANRGVENVVPYYTKKKYIVNRFVPLYRLAGTEVTKIFYTSGNYFDLTGTMFHSLGPDIRLTMYRRIPTIYVEPLVSFKPWRAEVSRIDPPEPYIPPP